MSCREFLIRYEWADGCGEEQRQSFSPEEAVQSFVAGEIARHPECISGHGIDLPLELEIREAGSESWRQVEIRVQMKPTIAVRIA